jgi:hypothetical protein
LSTTVYDTILELLLQKYVKTEDKKEIDRVSQQILTLLQDPKVKYFPKSIIMFSGSFKVGIDVTRAMVACQKYNFKPGVIALYDKAHL